MSAQRQEKLVSALRHHFRRRQAKTTRRIPWRIPGTWFERGPCRSRQAENARQSENTNISKLKRLAKIAQARVEKIPTFQELAEDWLALKENEWVAKSAKQNRGRLAANVYPTIGDMPVNQITVADVERALKFIIERGSLEVARRVHTLIVCVFKYGLSRQVIENPDIVVRLTWYKENMPKRKKTEPLSGGTDPGGNRPTAAVDS